MIDILFFCKGVNDLITLEVQIFFIQYNSILSTMSPKHQEHQLEERLLNDDLRNQDQDLRKAASKSFGPAWLIQLFDLDFIKDKKSNKLLESINGYQGLKDKLKTDLEKGISASPEDKKDRIKKYGKNDPVVKPPKTLWDMVLQNFEDPMLRILCIAAFISLTLGIATHGLAEGWLQGFSILLAVMIITVVASGNNYMKQQQFRKLNEVAKRKNMNVIRNGKVHHMSVYELLVGDVVQVETGEIISVDGVVIEANRLSVDQSSMTGETNSVKKDIYEKGSNKNCFLVSGTMVVEGTGKMLVLTVGVNTFQNKLKMTLQKDDDQTPLEQKLQILADQIGKLGMLAAAVTLAALTMHLIIDCFKNGHAIFSLAFLSKFIQYVIIAVSLIVMAVPQGLPLAVTISLAYSVGKMKDENNLVRYLQACETMGGANNICSDKTGTLTKNQMTVTKLWALDTIIDKFTKEQKIMNTNLKELLSYGIAINSDAHPIIEKGGKFKQIGNKTECALLEMAYKFGYNYIDIRESTKAINTIPFSSQRKRMSVIFYHPQKQRYYLFSKGAPEILIESCRHFINKSAAVTEITPTYKKEFEQTVSEFSQQSLRNILLCYKEITKEQSEIKDPVQLQKLEQNLIVLAVAGIKDPLKETVPDAVLNCKKAGITVRMVTGDNIETATAIAKDAHIIPSNFVRPKSEGQKNYYVVMQGKEFRTLVGGIKQVPIDQNDEQYKKDSDDQDDKHGKHGKKGEKQTQMKDVVDNLDKFEKIVGELRVLARSSPQDKYLLATGLKQLNNVVAMTGDGTNDAPALKKADIGFAMGIAGTEVAKQAAGIILLDDNFSSIITAVKYGRNIFDCIRKFLQFQLTVNIVAIFMAILSSVILKRSPLTPIQMLWVNLIMDTLAALALATQPPSNQLLKRMPYSRKEHIITAQMWRVIIFNAIYQCIVLTIILFKGDKIFNVKNFADVTDIEFAQWNHENGEHLSLFFNVFVFLQVFNFLNCRKLKKQEVNIFTQFFDNYLFIAIVISIFICQLFIVQYGGEAFKLVPLEMHEHFQCIIIGATGVVWAALVKMFVPDSFMNNFALLREDHKQKIINVDSIFERYTKQPASQRRKSKAARNSRHKG